MDDSELVKDILDGNIQSFDKIINKYEYSVYRFILAMVRDTEEAKDLTQDVFITIYNKLYMYRGKSKFSSWLYKIARNKSMDYIRKNKKIIQLSIEDARNISSHELLPEQWLEFKEMRKELQNFIESQDSITKQILILKSSDSSLKLADIAEILKINISTVKTKYYRLWDKCSSFISEKRCKAL